MSKRNNESPVSEEATFAGGCFWCMQGPFDAQTGVSTVQVGYAGGSEKDASYYTVASGATQHREAIHVQFDPAQVSYRTLIEIFFRQIDPTDSDGQFADRGFQYTTAVYYHNDEQRVIAEAFVHELNASKKFHAPVATLVIPFTTFFPAEEEHQAYYKKNPLQYRMYKMSSGRADFVKKIFIIKWILLEISPLRRFPKYHSPATKYSSRQKSVFHTLCFLKFYNHE